MIIYIEDKKKLINTDQIACIKACRSGRFDGYAVAESADGNRITLCDGPYEKSCGLVEMIATAMDRGQEMLWIAQEDSE